VICNIRDIPVYYEEYGSGKPVLCIHGYSVDHRLMTGCLEPVFRETQGYRRIYLDLPGMGKTPSKSWMRNSNDMLEVLSGFIDAVIAEESFLIAGESYGGRLTLGLIYTMGNRIDGVLLICSNLPEGALPARKVIVNSEVLESAENDPDLKTFLDVAVLATPEIYQKFKSDVLPGIKAADQDFLHNHYQGAYDPDFQKKLKSIGFDRPACILAGRQDHWVGYAGVYELLDDFPRATFAVLDCAGHNMQIDNELLFSQLVKDWIWRVELNRSSRSVKI